MKGISHSLPIGTTLKGKSNTYTIVDVLGQGSFGITYLAEFQIYNAEGNNASILVAIKEFFMHEINGRKDSTVTTGSKASLFEYYKNKFYSESRNLANLNHPNIIKVIDNFAHNNTYYYVMEYVDAGSLDRKIENNGCLEEQDALTIVRQVGSALKYMHDQGMLHLDVKPGNIMLRSSGDCVLIDFGLSKQYDENGDPESSTTVGSGTPGYAPLEQINRDKDSGFPVTMDVYALAASLYKMLTGNRPPLPSYILNKGFPSNKLSSKGVTVDSISAIERAMRPRKNERPQSIDEFISLLPMFADVVETVNDVSSSDDLISNTEEKAASYEPATQINNNQDEINPLSSSQPSKPVQPERGYLGHSSRYAFLTKIIIRCSKYKKIISIVICCIFIGYYGWNKTVQYISLRKQIVTSFSKTCYVNNHMAVDLGVSVLWADKNLGSDERNDAGEPYSWGNPDVKYKDKERLISLDYEDVASEHWGKKWRTPTKNEWQELLDVCDWKWTNINGVKGYLVTSKKTKESIFLPITDLQSLYGGYWSSTGGLKRANILYFFDDKIDITDIDREQLRSIRAVCNF